MLATGKASSAFFSKSTVPVAASTRIAALLVITSSARGAGAAWTAAKGVNASCSTSAAAKATHIFRIEKSLPFF